MADAGGDGAGLVGLVIEDHERRCALGGEGVVILARILCSMSMLVRPIRVIRTPMCTVSG